MRLRKSFQSIIQEEAGQQETLVKLHQQLAKVLNFLQAAGLAIESDQTVDNIRQVKLKGTAPAYEEITIDVQLKRFIDPEGPEIKIHSTGVYSSDEPPAEHQDLIMQMHALLQIDQSYHAGRLRNRHEHCIPDHCGK